MFICHECGEVFEEPKIIEEHHPYGMTYATEEWAVCPHCGENNFDKAKKCSMCGEYVAEVDEEELCEVCHSDMYD